MIWQIYLKIKKINQKFFWAKNQTDFWKDFCQKSYLKSKVVKKLQDLPLFPTHLAPRTRILILNDCVIIFYLKSILIKHSIIDENMS
jgi:hypothetical protein